MPRVLALLSLVVVSVLALAARCGAPPGPQIFSPSGDVFDFIVAIQVQVPGGASFDPNTGVTLNGVPIPVTGGPNVFEATVAPGSPLEDANTLILNCVLANGFPASATRNFSYLPPKARARQITDPDDLIEGPLAHGRVGDWLIENSHVRFVVQGVGSNLQGLRDMYSVGGFGGNVIDLELKSNPGNDNFIEIQPMLNVETVVNATTMEVVNDGQDGTTAILRACGPDDLLDFVNPSSQIAGFGQSIPPNLDDNDQTVDACTEYRLDPQVDPAAPPVRWLEMETIVSNFGGAQVMMLVGDWYNPGGQLEMWARNNRLGEFVTSAFGVISHFAYGEYEGVDYGYTTGPVNPSLPPPTQGSTQFTQSGVTVILHSASVAAAILGGDPPFFVDAGQERGFTRYLSVGDGSGANGAQMQATVLGNPQARIQGCVTVDGTPLPGSRVAVVPNANPNLLQTTLVTRPGPCPNYSGATAAGTFRVSAWRAGTPYQGGGATPTFTTFTAVANNTHTVNIDLPATGRLEAQVEDESGAPLPARVSVIGFDPSPPLTALAVVPLIGNTLLGQFEDPKEALPFGIVAFGYADANGEVAFDVEPGSYQVVVSRGTEYSMHSAPLSITTGATTSVSVQLARVLDTTGFVSSDFHVHGIRSADSRVADGPRVAQFAGEGVENIIMTDHHVHTDLTPTITALGLGNWVASTIGEEITTFDYGHFNGYPFTIDPSVPSGGSTDWGQAAPPGQDFPSAGAFNATPAQIHALATAGDVSTPDTTIQVNHIDSHFAPMQINTSVAGPISDGLDAMERAALRLPSGAGNLFHHFPALELWNGADRNQQNNFLNERIGIWMNHLNKGLRTTAISDTDTHTFGDLESAGARTWTAAPSDAVPGLSGGAVANAVDAGRAVGGQGLYVQTRLLAASTGQIADLTLAGSTDATTTDGAVQLEIRVQAPRWAQFDRIEVYANATTTPVNVGAPYLFGATPTLTLLEGDCDPATTDEVGDDFDITVVDVHPSVPGGERQDVTVTVPFAGLTQDTWFAVVVRGSDGVCPPLFPVYPRSLDDSTNATLADLLDGNVGEIGTMALGVANALYLEVNGVAGFQPPNP